MCVCVHIGLVDVEVVVVDFGYGFRGFDGYGGIDFSYGGS